MSRKPMDDTDLSTRICICLPTLNEELNVLETLQAIRKEFSGLIFLVDGFSSDRTVELAEQFGVSVFKREDPGKGSAIMKALEIAERNGKEFLVYLDCDQTYNPADILHFSNLLDDSDLIIGMRPLKGINPFHRRLGNRIATGLINLSFNGNITDSISGFKCLRVSGFKSRLTEEGFVIDALICALALHRKMRINLVEVQFSERSGKSKMNFLIGLREFWKLIIHIIKLKLEPVH